MIIELFGLPGTGKSTYSRAWREQRITVVRALSRTEIITENIRFFMRYPITSVRLCSAVIRFSPPRLRYTLFMNAFLVQNAKYMRARRLSRKGKVVGIDQGHFQNILSLFRHIPDEAILRSFIRMLPRPDLLLILDVPKEERERRVAARDWKPRAEFGVEESERFLRVAEELYTAAVPLLEEQKIPHRVLYTHADMADILTHHISYVTAARMPTEKAHGVSIAYMCESFAGLGREVSLVVPTRFHKVKEDLWSYYGIEKNFTFERVRSPDFIGRGYTHPLFFFVQRLIFSWKARCAPIAPGIVYTREPEIAWAFAGSHRAVFEAHNWPSGLWGRLQAYLVRNAALIVCNSKGTETAAKAAGLTNTIVAPNGFDPKQFAVAESQETARARLGIPLDVKVALYIGALDERKGVQTLFEASESLPADTVWVIGGTKGEIEKLSLKYPKVRFLGYSPYREIANNLSAADVLVLPNTAQLKESAEFTSPIKLFAYLASRKPIIASDVPSVRAYLEEEGSDLVPPDDPEGLARAIQERFRIPYSTESQYSSGAVFTWSARAKKILTNLNSSL